MATTYPLLLEGRRLCFCYRTLPRHYSSFIRKELSFLVVSPRRPYSSYHHHPHHPHHQKTRGRYGLTTPGKHQNHTITSIPRQLSPPNYRLKSSATSNTTSNTSNITSNSSGSRPDSEVVYVAPLKAAVRAIKVFSLTTAVAAFFGGPVLVWMGNPSVPLVGRVMMSGIVMLVGLGTTALLHWLVKGYVMRMSYSRRSGDLLVHTVSLLGTLKKHSFNISEAGPPSKATAFSSFQARGKSFFMHTEVFEDRALLSKILGAYSVFEEPKTWQETAQSSSKSTE